MALHGQIWDPKKHGDGTGAAAAGGDIMGSSMEDMMKQVKGGSGQ